MEICDKETILLHCSMHSTMTGHSLKEVQLPRRNLGSLEMPFRSIFRLLRSFFLIRIKFCTIFVHLLSSFTLFFSVKICVKHNSLHGKVVITNMYLAENRKHTAKFAEFSWKALSFKRQIAAFNDVPSLAAMFFVHHLVHMVMHPFSPVFLLYNQPEPLFLKQGTVFLHISI